MPTMLPDEEICKRLKHVYWIGGGTDAGKTSTARWLSSKYGFSMVHFDRHAPSWERGALRSPTFATDFPHTQRWVEMGEAKRWHRDPAEHEAHVYQMWQEQLPFRLQNLLDLPADQPIVAEGYGFLPSLIAPWMSRPNQAIWLLPSPEFKHKTFYARVAEGAKASYRHRIPDPEIALENHKNRDMMITDRIRRESAALNLPIFEVDGSRPIQATFAYVEAHFQLGLP